MKPITIEVQKSGAIFDDEQKYRYALWRSWELDRWTALKAITFIGLNPSTADAIKDDATIRSCRRLAREWGFLGLIMVNLFAYRATHPAWMKEAFDPEGEENDDYIKQAVQLSGLTVCCWGNHGSFMARGRKVIDMLTDGHHQVYHLGLTKSGEPRHPLYLPTKGTLPLKF